MIVDAKVLSLKIASTAIVTLNRPSKLNVLDEDMIDALTSSFNEFLGDDQVKKLIIQSSSEKAFCAGGDVVSVVKGINEGRDVDFFFKKEYAFDQGLYRAAKPVFVIAEGFVFGGGLGIFSAAQSRVCSENAVFCMPEVTIGFFPDVASSFFLQRVPKPWRLLMGLCGARIKASWALELGLVDNVFRKGLASEVSRCIQADSLIDEPLLASATQEDLQEMRAISKIIEPLQLMSSIGEFHEWVMHSRDTLKHPYILACLETYLKGSRLSSFITWRLFEWSLGKSVEECFEMDLELSRLLGKDLDFHEGVRALLIDKDKSPKFRFNSYETIEESFVMPF